MGKSQFYYNKRPPIYGGLSFVASFFYDGSSLDLKQAALPSFSPFIFDEGSA